MTDPTYPQLIARVAELEEQLAAVTEERDALQREVEDTEEERQRRRRLDYISRGWGP